MNSRTGRSRDVRYAVLLGLAIVGEAALTLTALVACTSAPPAAPVQIETRTKVVDTSCSWTKPIYLNKADVLTDDTAAEILEHNRAGAKNCGWKPLSAK
ncbi:hypothetical protein [Burkholderia gladioli]|uniref:hypothetical protein n=1 Tax=Burkholderia gladioli TaxID=28095 RepID=UPI001FC8CF44|nr:hypothetical protein [Burkholderia gladioli]